MVSIRLEGNFMQERKDILEEDLEEFLKLSSQVSLEILRCAIISWMIWLKEEITTSHALTFIHISLLKTKLMKHTETTENGPRWPLKV